MTQRPVLTLSVILPVLCYAFSDIATSACSAEDPGIAPLEPTPHSTPLAPPVDSQSGLSPDQLLQRRLHDELRERDRQIEALRGHAQDATAISAGTLPAVLGATLEVPRKERDSAWLDLQKSLHAFDDTSAHAKHDVLDIVHPSTQATQIGPLSTVNELRIAGCYQELAASANAAPGDLDAGAHVLEQLNANDLPDAERPRYQFLRVWFFAEQARHSSGDQRPALIASANTALQVLQQMPGSSELASAAASLLIDLTPPAAEKAP